MSYPSQCSACGSADLRWVSAMKQDVVDVLVCRPCDEVLVEEDWVLPVGEIGLDRCLNCSYGPVGEVCEDCGLTPADAATIHREMAALVGHPDDFLAAARAATGQGRRVLAVKLATAGALREDGQNVALCRALRIWLLASLGEEHFALADAERWVSHESIPPFLAWASFAQQAEHQGMLDEAKFAYKRALAIEAHRAELRSRYAKLLVLTGELGVAIRQVRRAWDARDLSGSVRAERVEVTGLLVEALLEAGQVGEIKPIVDHLGPICESSASLCKAAAFVAVKTGDVERAQQLVARAVKLDPSLDLTSVLRAVGL